MDLIYIDPPYNTGNKDFRYNDNFVDKENGGRHTLWLSFMKTRLELAKELLKDTGVIFISIDDNEQANLKLLCDRVFKEENWVGTFIWKSRQIVDSRNKNNVSNDHEYVLIFGKTQDVKLKGKLIDRGKYSNPDKDTRGAWMSNSILGLANKDQRPNLHYDLIDPKTDLVYSCPPNTGWRYSRETMNEKIKDTRIVFPKSSDGRPREKKFLSEISSDFTGFSTILSEDNGFTLNGTREVRDIVDSKQFSFPKPVALIQNIVNQTTDKDTPSVVLDFFAGSGTTGHAVLELNKQDGGRRQFILVTNNEVTDKTQAQLRKDGKTEAEIHALGICRSVTYPRLQKVIEGYTTPKGDKVAGTGGKMRYYRTEYVERSPNFDQQA